MSVCWIRSIVVWCVVCVSASPATLRRSQNDPTENDPQADRVFLRTIPYNRNVEMNQLLEEYNTMASSKHSTSRGHREFDVDEEDSQEPSMEMEQDESKPVVPMPVSPEVSSALTCLSSNPALQLQPGDTCLAVWAEDGVSC